MRSSIETHRLSKKSAKPNFKVLGSKVGKDMKAVTGPIFAFTNEQIALLESGKTITVKANENTYQISIDDIEIKTADIPGWQIMSDSQYTVALDLELTAELRQEGIARELVNKIQNLRKDKSFEITDKITIRLVKNSYIKDAVEAFNEYICGEVLAESLVLTENVDSSDTIDIDQHTINIKLSK